MIVFGTADYTPPVAEFGQRAGTLILRYRLGTPGSVVQRAIDVPHKPMPLAERRAIVMRLFGCLLLN